MAETPPPAAVREIGANRTIAGTVGAMVVGYLASAAFGQLAPGSQQQYRRIFEGLRREHGDKRVAKLERKHVRAMVDAKASTPCAARDLLRCFRLLTQYAINIGVRADDPTAGVTVKVADTGGHKCWSEAEIETFETKFPIGTKPRLAMAVLLYTAQRCCDAVRLGQPMVRAGALHFVQVKDRKHREMTIPVRAELQAVIDGSPMVGIATYLVNECGRPFTAKGLSKWFSAQCHKASLPHLSAHGLRKAAMRRMAEAGWSESEISAWSGHDSLREIVRYTRAANRARMARNALDRGGENKSRL
jgi:integrase